MAIADGFGLVGEWNNRFRGLRALLLDHALVDIGSGFAGARNASGWKHVLLGNSRWVLDGRPYRRRTFESPLTPLAGMRDAAGLTTCRPRRLGARRPPGQGEKC